MSIENKSVKKSFGLAAVMVLAVSFVSYGLDALKANNFIGAAVGVGLGLVLLVANEYVGSS